MASINDISLQNTYSINKNNKKQLLSTLVYMDGVYVGELLNKEKFNIYKEEQLPDILFRCKDYLIHNELFLKDLNYVGMCIDGCRYEKLIKLVLEDLSVLDNLEFLYNEKLQKGVFVLRAKLGKEQHIFKDPSHFKIKTKYYIRRSTFERDRKYMESRWIR